MARPTVRKEDLWTDLDTSLALAHWRVEQGDIPSSDQLGRILKANIDKPPKWLLELVAAELMGELKRKRGRRPHSEWREIFLGLARHDYRKVRHWLERRKTSRGLRGWAGIRGASWWKGAPGERAARMVLRHYQKKGEFVMIDVRRFQNLLSPSRKKR